MTAITMDMNTPVAKPASRWRQVWSNLRRSPSGMIGLSMLTLHLLMALLAPWLAPYDWTLQDGYQILQPPSEAFWFGTDHMGRDLLSRTMMGGREAITVTLLGTLLAVGWGGLVGMTLGFVGGRVDAWVMRFIDALLAIPWLLFLLLVIALVGQQTWTLVLTLGFFFGIAVVRVVRGATLEYVPRDFVIAARTRGESRLNIVVRELLPNVLDALLVEAAMRWAWMLLAFSSLSFLGFGVVPPTPDWGLMIADSRGMISIAPWAVIFPALALSTLIISINLTADALAKAIGLDRAKAPV
ncbi:ABC transporter permease [Marinobacterium stanieri]|uniref:Peptide/nickel transport system permease protein n=1 Tax=Marinobacterium stanieri TaxID=49186 RepID=A0A1N6S697_9GAMM|nr:ABC transporter permease [Marinobacterium stanieri]SIQ36492.1 peptide/nickel transport system permease protein [Marinobacterium stanieri]